MVISDATERSAETNLPESSACRRSGSMVRRPERRGRDRDRFPVGLHAHIEFRLDVDAHAVAGDQRVLFLAHDLHLQDVHVDGRDSRG